MGSATGTKYLMKERLPHQWCPGCGDGIVLSAMLRAFEELEYEKTDTVVVTGIGCWGKADNYLLTNAVHTTHGRALPVATGIKAVKPKLHVVVLMGDGDGVTIGGNHFIHAARRNIDLTAIILNNSNYGMTGGQFSATTPHDSFTSTSIYGNPERSFDICSLANAAGANFVARETVVNGRAMQNIIKQALQKKGFSVVEAVSVCTTLFGPRNNMKKPADMMNWLKEKGIPKARFEKLDVSERQKEMFVTGILTDRDDPDFNTSYDVVRSKAQGGNPT
jgi:2-oxoglutarate ferredoxin oxidoreductase subunit beta